jgi:hypothetical protein
MDIRDVIANFLGALAAILTWPWVRPIFFPRLRSGDDLVAPAAGDA